MTHLLSLFVLLNLIIFNQVSAASQTQFYIDDPAEVKKLQEDIKHKQERLESVTEQDTTNLTTLKELYKAAQSHIEDYLNSRLKIENSKQVQSTIKQDITTIERDITSLRQSKPSTLNVKSLDIEQLNLRIRELESKILEKQTSLNNLIQQRQLQQDRPLHIQIELQNVSEQLYSVTRQLGQLNPGTQPDYQLFDAQQLILRSYIMALQAKQYELNQELTAHPDIMALLQKSMELISIEIKAFNAEIKYLEQQVAELREQHSIKFTQLMSESLTKSGQPHPVLNETVQVNLALNSEYKALLDAIHYIEKYKQQLDAEQQLTQSRTEKADKLLALSEISPSLAAALRQQRFDLVEFQINLQNKINQLISREKASLRQFELEDNLDKEHDINQKIQNALEYPGVVINNQEAIALSGQIRLLMTEQHKLTGELESAYSEYISKLDSLEFKRQALDSQIDSFTDLLDTNLLWVRTASPVNAGFFNNLVASFEWLISPSHWKTVLDKSNEGIHEFSLITIVICVFLIISIFSRSYVIQKSQDINRLVSDFRTDHLSLTIVSLLLLILRVLPLVGMMYYLGWILAQTAEDNSFVMDISTGLRGICVPLFFLQIFYLLFSNDGVAAKHLRWPKQSITVLRQQLKWLRYAAIPSLFLAIITHSSSILQYSDSLGRLALIAMTVIMSVTLYRVTHPVKGALKQFFDNRPHSLLYKLRYPLFFLIVGYPLVVGVFAATGYLASAFELQLRTINSIRLIFVAIITYTLALRGLRLFNVNIAIQKYQEKKSSEKTEDDHIEKQDSPFPQDLSTVNIAAINQQTRRLLSFMVMFALAIGIWLVWRDLIPALAITDELVLWTKSSVIGENTINVSITLANLLMALFYLVAGFFATRNLPGLLEVLFLNRFMLQPGTRYATIQLLNYTVVGVVLFFIFKELGAEWSQIQWLVAALGVGLGFGLQEIFANMISGLILLFERPIRIGDIVTVGETSGTVTKIQIRATTITDWDKKELLVPNKNFITDHLVNWTLTDTTTRLVIKVGVAYGSNTQLVYQTLLDIANSHSQVVKDPAPVVLFTEFADSSLNFEVRVFVRNVLIRLAVLHDLNTAIDHKFRELNISIPFPQRDVHLFNAAKETE